MARQGAIIHDYQEELAALQAAHEQIKQTPSAPPLSPKPAPQIAAGGFLRQFFTHQPIAYCDELANYAFLLSLLTGRALDWASTMWDADPQVKASFEYFSKLIHEVFEYPAGGAILPLNFLNYAKGSNKPPIMPLSTLAAQSEWNDPALLVVFCEGLCPALQVEMACRSTNITLSEYITIAIRLDNLIQK